MAREITRLSELRGGLAALERLADDKSRPPEQRAQGVVGLLIAAGNSHGHVEADTRRRAEAILQSGETGSRLRVVDALPSFSWNDEFRPLLRLAARDSDPRVRARAAWKLLLVGDAGDKQLARDVLTEILENLPTYPVLDERDVRCSLYFRGVQRDETATLLLERILADADTKLEHRALAQLATEYRAQDFSKGYQDPPFLLVKDCPRN